jgi:hypothetical protein
MMSAPGRLNIQVSKASIRYDPEVARAEAGKLDKDGGRGAFSAGRVVSGDVGTAYWSKCACEIRT